MKYLILTFMVTFFVGCQTSSVITGSKHSRVYLDGEYKGKGERVEISSFGSHGSAKIVVKNETGKKSIRVKRQFTATTLIGSIYTYGLGLFFLWELPSSIYIDVKGDEKNPWNMSQEHDPWLVEKL